MSVKGCPVSTYDTGYHGMPSEERLSRCFETTIINTQHPQMVPHKKQCD